MVMAVVEHADAAGEVEDPPAGPGPEVGPLGAFDQLTAEPERGHQGHLAAVDVPAREVVDVFRRELLAFFDADQIRHAATLRAVHKGRSKGVT